MDGGPVETLGNLPPERSQIDHEPIPVGMHQRRLSLTVDLWLEPALGQPVTLQALPFRIEDPVVLDPELCVPS